MRIKGLSERKLLRSYKSNKVVFFFNTTRYNPDKHSVHNFSLFMDTSPADILLYKVNREKIHCYDHLWGLFNKCVEVKTWFVKISVKKCNIYIT